MQFAVCVWLRLTHLYIKTIILPRQARDKHRENSKKMLFFVPGIHFQLTEQATLLSAWYQIQPCTCIGRMGMMCGIHRFDCVPPQQDNKTRTHHAEVSLPQKDSLFYFLLFSFALLRSVRIAPVPRRPSGCSARGHRGSTIAPQPCRLHLTRPIRPGPHRPATGRHPYRSTSRRRRRGRIPSQCRSSSAKRPPCINGRSFEMSSP